MTQYHYISAPRKLPCGSYGEVYTLRKLSDIPKPDNEFDLRNLFDLSDLEDQYTKVYETELDFISMTIKEAAAEVKNDLPLSLEYIYELGGSFSFDEEDVNDTHGLRQELEKCSNELVAYLKEHLDIGESVEIYSCWSGEERLPRDEHLDLTIKLEQIQSGMIFRVQDRQLIKVENI